MPRLDDKDSIYTLQPNVSRDADLIALIKANGTAGSIFQLLAQIPEQGEDLYTVLVDDLSVLTFEVDRISDNPVAREFRSSPLARYRDELGQGKRRIRLDHAVENARKMLVR
jgi:hypothetical protein